MLPFYEWKTHSLKLWFHCLSTAWEWFTVKWLQTVISYDFFSIQSIFFIVVIFQAQWNVAFVTYHSYVKEAFVKQELNAGPFLHNNWHEVKYAGEVIHTDTCTLSPWTKTDRLFPPHNSLFVHLATLFILSLSLWCSIHLDTTYMYSCAVWDLGKVTLTQEGSPLIVIIKLQNKFSAFFNFLYIHWLHYFLFNCFMKYCWNALNILA